MVGLARQFYMPNARVDKVSDRLQLAVETVSDLEESPAGAGG